jgi:class 3 adenylate cyclase/tetratricopeptide (TPR) repeat protein
MFTDLSGSTDMSMGMEAESYANLILALHDIYESCVTRHGGAVVQTQGDGVLACFGYPDVGEHDGRNAVDAALNIKDEVGRLRVPGMGEAPLQVHSGIHSGLTLLQGARTGARGFNIFGPTVNIAAKLSDLAGEGEVIVSAESLGPDRFSFEISAPKVLDVPGMQTALRVYSVTGWARTGALAQANRRRGLSRFVGRSDEIARIAGALVPDAGGALRAVWVLGPTGIGKTRLVEEGLAAHTPHGAQVLRARCDGYLTAAPLQPVAQIVRGALGLDWDVAPGGGDAQIQDLLGALDPALCVHAGALLSVLAPGAAATHRADPVAPEQIDAAVMDLLTCLARAAPQIIFVDGLQWADDASRRVIDALCHLGDPAIFVLMTARDLAPGELDGKSDAVINLSALAPLDAESLTHELLPGVSDFERARIIAYSGRNALYLEELCRAFLHVSDDRQADLELARDAWLAKIIEARIERLSQDCAQILRVASVIGYETPVWLLEAAAGKVLNADLLQQSADSDFLLADATSGALRFRHGVARDVIYSTVAAEDRRSLHGNVAREIADRFGPLAENECCELLTFHFAGSTAWEDAARFAEMAGKKAEKASTLDRAQAHYSAALRYLAELEDTPETYRRWMNVCRRYAYACVYDPAKSQLPVFADAIARARERGDRQQACEATFWMGYVEYALGLSGPAIAHLEAAGTEAAALGQQELGSQIFASIGQAYAAASRYDKALVLLEKTVEVKRQFRKPGKPAVSLGYSLACLASTLGDLGRFAQAQECIDEALWGVAGARHEVESSVLLWKSGILLWQGRWEEARATAAAARTIGERVKSIYLQGTGAAQEAFAQCRLGGDEITVARLVNTTGWLESADKRLFISLNYGRLADVMAARGDWAGLRRYGARALACGRNEDLLGGAMAARALARAAAQGQMRKGPEHYLALAQRNAARRGAPHEVAANQLLEAQLLGTGTPAGARLLDLAQRGFEGMDMPWHAHQVEDARRLVGGQRAPLRPGPLRPAEA